MSHWSEIKTALDAGEVVILPTETVYGLAARADMADAVSKIYDIKGRDFDKPLAVCVPGSLTLVLNVKDGTALDPRVTSNSSGVATIALRCPDADWRADISDPLALTSANRSGR